MGRIRLGRLPRTRQWKQVVALLDGGAGTAQLANATITAAEKGLNLAAEDKGLVEIIWLLSQLPLAARKDNFAAALHNAGLDVSDSPGLMEIVGAMSDAIDRRLANNSVRTDLGEMARMAASETINEVVVGRLPSLFVPTPDDVRTEFARLATNKQFSTFARDFFARVTNKCPNYFLSQAIAHHIGEGRRFTTLAEQSEFSKAMETHCIGAARIVEEFSGGWFSKTNWESNGIPHDKAAGFSHVAMRKLVAELKERACPDAD